MMNNFNPQTLYSDLLALCAPEDSPFYYVDHKLGINLYRVFTYRLGQYSDFIKPNARECRGHMFQIREDGTMIRLAALPMQKFFNLGENPFTMDMDFSQGAELIMTKEDGSLISSYVDHPGKLRLKSKTALESEQALAAMAYLASNKPLHDFVEVMTGNNYTVNMEFTSPQYRIVVPHQHDSLTVLNVRNNATGEYMGYESVRALMRSKNCEPHLVANFAESVKDLKEFVDSVPSMNDSGLEGYVVRLRGGETFKIKTEAYVALHRLKDSLNSPKRLFEVVVNEASDDAKAQFKDDPYLVSQIEDMEKVVAAIWVKLKHNVIEFHNANRALDRKSYAIKGQADLDRLYFGLAMTLYLDKEPDYKGWMLKHYKELGIKDDAIVVDDEG
jgi:T4 RnlA family RNA ligase